MTESMLPLLRCPVTRSPLRLELIQSGKKLYNGIETTIIKDGILFSDSEWFYPIIDGIPRLIVEAVIDYSPFLSAHLPDFFQRREALISKHASLLAAVQKKNDRTKQSFAYEWKQFDYQQDRTWEADKPQMLHRFLTETDETAASISGKLIFDAGCGNGQLNQLIAAGGATVLGMDFSRSIEKAFNENTEANALFIQGDVQYPPVAFDTFDIVHCSGVLIHTNNTQQSFNCLVPCVKVGGKLSVWLYHPRKNAGHRFILLLRKMLARLPLRLLYWICKWILFPLAFILKRIKGNRQPARELMIDILDQFTPEFRWEHTHEEAMSWFEKNNFEETRVTTSNIFGFNITGKRKQP
jgi:2-polyprenyl-3-methyl-5-hydroxy-6-metoxy-1,4-benzoquinol methylase/uncharacterized protein YbaR (Trm112 family)